MEAHTLGLHDSTVVACGHGGLTFGSEVRRSLGAITEPPRLERPERYVMPYPAGAIRCGRERYACPEPRLVGAVRRWTPLAVPFVDLAGLDRQRRVLDVGCGPGALLGELINRVGVDGVAGVDPSEPFVAAAIERYPEVDVRRASAEQLPFDDDSFDAALAQLIVHFMADWWSPFEGGVGPAGAYVASLGAIDRQALSDKCRGLLGEGPFTVEATAWAATGAAT